MNHASSLIIEDHLKHVLTRTGGKPFKTSNNKNLPRALHSAFGDFPKDYMAKGQGMAMMPKPLDQAELSVAATAVKYTKKGEGIGGNTSSLRKPREKPAV